MSAGPSESTYFNVLRSMTQDPEILAAVDAVEGGAIAELRARAEKAEAALADVRSEWKLSRDVHDRCHGAMLGWQAEAQRLRDGIQALADTYHGYGAKCFPGGDFADDLRRLLSPTPEGPTP